MASDSGKRQRTDMTPFKSALEDAWNGGLKDYSSEACVKKIKELAVLLGISEKKIKCWIDNRKQKEKQDKLPKTDVRPKIRSKLYKRKLCGFDFFKKELLSNEVSQMNPPKLVMSKASQRWASMSAKEKMPYEDLASKFVPPAICDLADNEKGILVRSIKSEMKRLCDQLELCGLEAAVLIANVEKSTTSVFGTQKGAEYLECQPRLELNFISYCDGITMENKNDPHKLLREKVQNIFNQKYAQATGGKGKRMSYKLLGDGKIEATGLPEDVILKRPSAYSRKHLQLISDNQDRIEFTVLSEEPGIADDAVQVAMDIESPFLVMESNRDVIAPEAEASGSGVHQAAIKPSTDSDTWSSVERIKKEKSKSSKSAKRKNTSKKEFEIESVREIRRRKGMLEFYIKWEGYDDNSNTWEPEEHLKKELVEALLKTMPVIEE